MKTQEASYGLSAVSGGNGSSGSPSISVNPSNVIQLISISEEMFRQACVIALSLPKNLMKEKDLFWKWVTENKNKCLTLSPHHKMSKAVFQLGFIKNSGENTQCVDIVMAEKWVLSEFARQKRQIPEYVKSRGQPLIGLLFELFRPHDLISESFFEPEISSERRKWRRRLAKDQRLRDLLKPILDLGPIGNSFIEFFSGEVGVYWPPKEPVVKAVADWLSYLIKVTIEDPDFLQRFKTDLEVEQNKPAVVSVVCPAYNLEDGRYKFTALSGGIGMVACNVLRSWELLYRWLVQEGLADHVIFRCVMPNEADDLENCGCVGLTNEEFIQRQVSSNNAFLAALSGELALRTDVVFMHEVIDPIFWKMAMGNASSRVMFDNWGEEQKARLGLTTESQKMAFLKRLEIYADWVRGGQAFHVEVPKMLEKIEWGIFVDAVSEGVDSRRWSEFRDAGCCVMTDENLDWLVRATNKFFRQIAEHVAAGLVISTRWPHAMVVQGETRWLSLWWQMMVPSIIPVLYLIQHPDFHYPEE